VETGKPFFVGRGDGRETRVRQPTTQYKAVSADTAGVYTFAEHQLVLDFPLHVHRREDEGIYVLDGSMTAVVGEETFRLGVGDFAFLPRGVPHSLTNHSDPAARFVFVSAPGGFEHLMDDFVEAAKSGYGPSSPEWKVLEDRHGLHFL
jgi:mannose-6-phosphate isomerase-like protein (cupin superfamily)